MNTSDLVRMMAYCNVAFCSYRSILKRGNQGGALLVFLRDLFQLVFLFKVNKTLDGAQVASIIFDAFLRYIDTDPRIEYNPKPSAPRLKQPMEFSLEHPSGQRIDFTISQQGEARVMTMKKVSSSVPAAGPVVSLEKVVASAWAIPMDILMRLLYRNELMRNNPGRLTRRQMFALLGDSDVRQAAVKMIKLYRGCFRRRKRS
ncbi:MAG: hypothetical protein HGB17_07980 [Syntrophobacteraceae bacterium]|nr:hypothetical protein [Syntrophobacteraceae bacterium]